MVDGLVNLVGGPTTAASHQFRRLQVGFAQGYAMVMVVGAAVLLAVSSPCGRTQGRGVGTTMDFQYGYLLNLICYLPLVGALLIIFVVKKRERRRRSRRSPRWWRRSTS